MVEQSRHGANGSEELGRYRLMATLGQGGMGTIHLAIAGGLGAFRKLLVLKELRRDLTRNERFVQMFLAEAKIAARLNHPNVVHTLEAGREGDRFFLAMEFLDGQPLSQILKSNKRPPGFPLAARLEVLCHALAGLHYAHELCDYDGSALQIVHRDVSPQNVFVTYDGQVKVVDFGIAKATGEDSLTSPGIFKGKLAYASPEQVRGQPVDRRSDVFSVGIMLWEVVAGRRFAPGSPTQAMVEARIAGTEPRLAEVVPDVEPLLAEICTRATHVDPAKRYATAEEFRSALQTFLHVSGEAVEAKVLGQTIRKMFADERAAMHRLIDAYIREHGAEDVTESMVRALRPSFTDEAGNEDPTTVGDLSQLIESSAPEAKSTLRPPEAAEPEPAPRSPKRGAPLVLAGVAVVAVFAFFATRGQEAAPVPSVTAPVSPPAAMAPAEPAKAAVPDPTTSMVKSTPSPSRADAPAHVKAPRLSPEPSPEPERPATPPPPPKAARVTGTETAATAAADTPKATKDPAPPKKNMGDDLRQLKQRAPRTLDTQDPFQ
jgi:serine/threonine protein kinase